MSSRPPLIRELLLVIVLYTGYKLGRRAANGQFSEAYENADRIWSLERAVYLPSEAWVQDMVLHSESLIRAINVYYATVHFPAMALFLIYMYWRRPGHYVWFRWVLTWLTGAALVLHLLMPLAPPRLFRTDDMVDTSAIYGPGVYDKPDPDSMSNQFAAMPSMHVGWAVLIALTLIVATRSRLRWLWLIHPLITVLAVVATGHHYWMDGIVACALLAIILVVLRPPRIPRPPVEILEPATSRPPSLPEPAVTQSAVTQSAAPRPAGAGAGGKPVSPAEPAPAPPAVDLVRRES
ncbi:phosphatase PAP2 family protein [Streptomyces sp. NBC_01803]|uniref:phosphatase PAP2 family protein n=1 Tax=Streptomyces sp. NBC_01803 TaxID=2975946 RepID=UPI002DDA47E8|nr:phosphatase PAP2 family protein [Streptomyces sp. NBC_01803]WSA43238.1 phosphatase PAP2 family protein [Streptomyces sp. NBC_01803]